jgi:hypothetical protein
VCDLKGLRVESRRKVRDNVFHDRSLLTFVTRLLYKPDVTFAANVNNVKSLLNNVPDDEMRKNVQSYKQVLKGRSKTTKKINQQRRYFVYNRLSIAILKNRKVDST